jgi:bifunctional UDP-N-acetylglucosamine pyrophosphorylase/glucosamine-1-phosphate N-acetyltransferase
VYVFEASWLWEALMRIPLSPKGEYYLTDLVGIAVAEGLSVQSITLEHPEEVIGINDRTHLAKPRLSRNRINTHWMLSGVTWLIRQHLYRSRCKIRSGHDHFAEHLSAWEDNNR